MQKGYRFNGALVYKAFILVGCIHVCFGVWLLE